MISATYKPKPVRCTGCFSVLVPSKPAENATCTCGNVTTYYSSADAKQWVHSSQLGSWEYIIEPKGRTP